jgi:hypothetical protein
VRKERQLKAGALQVGKKMQDANCHLPFGLESGALSTLWVIAEGKKAAVKRRTPKKLCRESTDSHA